MYRIPYHAIIKKILLDQIYFYNAGLYVVWDTVHNMANIPHIKNLSFIKTGVS